MPTGSFVGESDMPLSRRFAVKEVLQVTPFALCLLCARGPGASATEHRTSLSTQSAGQKPTGRRAKLVATAKAILSDPKQKEALRIEMIRAARRGNLRELKRELERSAKEDPSPKVRTFASQTIDFWEAEDAKAAERKARSEELRRRAAMTPEQRKQADEAKQRAYYAKHGTKLLRDLRRKLEDGTVPERKLAAMRVADLGRYVPEALPIARGIVETDPNPEVRYRALVSVLMALRDKAEAIALAQSCLAAGTDPSLRRVAATHLCCYGYKEGIPVLLELVQASEEPSYRARILGSLRATARVDSPELNPGNVLSRSWRTITDRDKPLLDQAVTAWQKWWQQKGAAFVFPRARATQPSSNPATRRKRP